MWMKNEVDGKYTIININVVQFKLIKSKKVGIGHDIGIGINNCHCQCRDIVIVS